MTRIFQLLLVEDEVTDAELILAELQRAGFHPDWRRVDNEQDFITHMERPWDLIVADYRLPQFNALRALDLLRERGVEVPVIVTTGALGDELAAEIIKQGATDYLLKDRLARLGTAVEGALAQKRLREEALQAELEQQWLREEIQRRNEELERRVQELEGLNRLFQQHLSERFAVVDAFRQLIEDLERNPRDMQGALQRARSQSLPDPAEVFGNGPEVGRWDAA